MALSTLAGSRAAQAPKATPDADQFRRRQANQTIASSPEPGAHVTTQAAGSTQELKKSRGATQILKFPLNREDMYPAYIVFHPYKIDTSLIDNALGDVLNSPLVSQFTEGSVSESVNDDVTANSTDPEVEGDAEEGGFFAAQQAGGRKLYTVEQTSAKKNQDEINQEIKNNQEVMGSKATDLRAYRDLTKPAIQLFFPPSLQYNDAVTYNSANLGAGGATALAGINSGQSIMGALGAGLSEGMESIFNLATGSLSAEAAKVASSRIASKLPAGYAAAGSQVLQTGMNPGTRLLFDQPAMRQFAFSFKLIPTSQTEAFLLENIIYNFRWQMYPREIDVAPGIPIGYEFPNIYRIEFGFQGGMLRIPKIQYCYLKDVQASYNSTSGGVFFEDGHPTEIDLTLTFLEYRALSKRDIDAGF